MDARTKDILETVDLKKVNIMSFASGYALEASKRVAELGGALGESKHP